MITNMIHPYTEGMRVVQQRSKDRMISGMLYEHTSGMLEYSLRCTLAPRGLQCGGDKLVFPSAWVCPSIKVGERA